MGTFFHSLQKWAHHFHLGKFAKINSRKILKCSIFPKIGSCENWKKKKKLKIFSRKLVPAKIDSLKVVFFPWLKPWQLCIFSLTYSEKHSFFPDILGWSTCPNITSSYSLAKDNFKRQWFDKHDCCNILIILTMTEADLEVSQGSRT